MVAFAKQVKAAHPTAGQIANRRWIYIPYDRYTDCVGPLREQPASGTRIVIVESTAKAFRRPYHKKKLIVLISNMRHFALEQKARGVSVLYHFSDLSHGQAPLELQRKHHLPSLTCMVPAERELRLDLSSARQSGLGLNLVQDDTWASTPKDFLRAPPTSTACQTFAITAGSIRRSRSAQIPALSQRSTGLSSNVTSRSLGVTSACRCRTTRCGKNPGRNWCNCAHELRKRSLTCKALSGQDIRAWLGAKDLTHCFSKPLVQLIGIQTRVPGDVSGPDR
jgi:hypothetical protein